MNKPWLKALAVFFFLLIIKALIQRQKGNNNKKSADLGEQSEFSPL